jgi:hypothetical protein
MEDKQKKILIGVGVALAILLGSLYFINAANASKKTPPTPPVPPKPDPKVDPVVDPVVNPVNNDELPYTSAQLADALEMAFQGYGTAWAHGDAGGVTGIISQLKSDADFDALNAAYAQRRIKSGFLNVFSKDFMGDMNGAFKSELSKSEIEELNMMLANQGIKRKIQ